MSTPTAINGFQKPVLTDAPPDIEDAVGVPLDQIDLVVHPRFANTAARDAAIPSPAAGMVCFVSGTGEHYDYSGTSWRGLKPRIVVKPTNQTVTDSVTPTNDTALVLPVETNSVYEVKMKVVTFSTGTTGNDIRAGFTVPASSSGFWTHNGATPGTVVGNFAPDAHRGALGWTATGQGWDAFTSGNTWAWTIEGTLITTNAGSLQFQFAELTSIGGVTSVTVVAGSYLRLLKVS